MESLLWMAFGFVAGAAWCWHHVNKAFDEYEREQRIDRRNR